LLLFLHASSLIAWWLGFVLLLAVVLLSSVNTSQVIGCQVWGFLHQSEAG